MTMRTKLWMLLVAAALSSSALAQEPDSAGFRATRKRPDLGTGLAQFGCATCGYGAVFGVGAALYLAVVLAGSYEHRTGSDAGMYVALGLSVPILALSPAAGGLAVQRMGDRCYEKGERGSRGWTIGGAYIGTATSGLLMLAGVPPARATGVRWPW